MTNEEVRNRIQNAIGVHDDLLTKVKKWKLRWPHPKILWHGKDNSARDSERSKKERAGKDGKVLLQRHLWCLDHLQG